MRYAVRRGPVQEIMVQKAGEKGATIETQSIKMGHTPCLVVLDEIAVFIRKQAGESFGP